MFNMSQLRRSVQEMLATENEFIKLQVVLEEGLDMSGLPQTLKEDFEKLDRLEGQFRVTSILTEVVNLEALSSSCDCIDVKEVTESMKKSFVEKFKPMTTLSKVIM